MEQKMTSLFKSFLTSFSIGNFFIVLNLLISRIPHVRQLIIEVWLFCLSLTFINLLQWLSIKPVIKYALIIVFTSIIYLIFAGIFHWMPLTTVSISLTFVGFATWYIVSWLGYWLYSRWLANRVNHDLKTQQ
ncbi:MAG: DUF3021 family protein [Furfurilactobacillus sp.]|jgi:hypothetical protein|uniref:DUF3021 family protein n=1 Tax=Furfurilactobacillus sp. TaxID=2767911 RepID=UPI00258ADE65|nr:DUF3021 family protein [Furfurilactobacillus sp.]MCH4010913.1 DUF3021 family protein [Furfurilactobacillus sp.]MCH4036805.1 DUF3021 family protein [Furfurilactobacillus sp.]MCH4114249.1 DUF3021 family protein [Furfurilactobacillus sp.]MCH4132928.1 DUF3021 family protein [Furfurilactobacillus sp.]MCI1339360.1 DUF3021 family protein [Furfurilactobacillus sp.]